MRVSSSAVAVRKEDIVSAVRRLLKRMTEVRDAKNTRLVGVTFDFEDFLDLAGLDNGETAAALIGLIALIVNYTHIVKPNEGHAPRDVRLKADRKQTHTVETSTAQHSVQDFSLSVRDTTASSDLTQD